MVWISFSNCPSALLTVQDEVSKSSTFHNIDYIANTWAISYGPTLEGGKIAYYIYTSLTGE